MLSLVADFQQNKPLVLNPNFVHRLRSILGDSSLDNEFVAKTMTLPGEGEIVDMMGVADPDAVHSVCTFIRKQLAQELKAELLSTVEKNWSSEEYVFDHPNMARRALKNIAVAPEYTELALQELNDRAEKRKEFFSKLEEKIRAREVERNSLQEKSKSKRSMVQDDIGRMKHEAMQDIGEVDLPLIFVPLPVRISQRFVDTGNSLASHLTTKMQKEVCEVFSNNMGTKSEPVISKCKESENWTKVSFKPDLAKFNMTHLKDDVVALLKKRVFDLAGCLRKSVKVLNGTQFPIKSSRDYVNLYLDSAAKSKPDKPPSYHVKVNDRWEICVSLSDRQFQQVRFVNSIATTKVSKSGIVDSLLLWATFKQSKDLKKSDGTKTEEIHGRENLDDANKIGGKESDKCTLILTEGDSAEALAVSCYVIVQSILALKLALMGFTFYDFYVIHSITAEAMQVGGLSSTIRGWEQAHQRKEGSTLQILRNTGKILFGRMNRMGRPLSWHLRSIPSMVDGLKRGQRKILLCSFKRNFVKEAKVAQFSGYVSEHSAYHHGEQSLDGIRMAQHYVGSNNINLLQPNGQFGTRNYVR
nr:dna topoisomerase 2 [Quercus suber]